MTPADLQDLRVDPLTFLDARTAVGTMTRGPYLYLTIDGTTTRDLARLRTADDPQFAAVTRAGDDLVWAQATDGRPWQIWIASRTTTTRLVADAGDILLGGGQHDLVTHAGRLYWAAGEDDTTIRDVPLAGGPVTARKERGQWSLTDWPWITTTGNGPVRLRNLETGQETKAQANSCTPQWCRVITPTGFELMHPDGSARRPVAGPGIRAAVNDVAVEGRYEIFSEPTAFSDLTGDAALVVYDITENRTIKITDDAGDVGTHDGVLWWSTGQSTLEWHTLPLANRGQ